MSSTIRFAVCLLASCTVLINPAPTHSQSAPTRSAPSEVNDLAAALAGAASPADVEGLLARSKELPAGALLPALKALADPLIQKGAFAEALRITQLAVRIAERDGDRRGLAGAQHSLGLIYSRQNLAPQALDALGRSLAIYEELGDRKETARVLLDIGIFHRLQGQTDQTLEYCQRSLAISEELGEKALSAAALNNIGIAHRLRGRFELALEFYRRTQALGQELKDKRILRNVSTSIGNIHQAQGSYDLALEHYRRSGQLSEEMNDRAGLAMSIYNTGTVHNFQGRYAEALDCFRRSMKINEELGGVANKRDLAYNLHSIGMLYVGQGRYEQALEYYHRSLKIRTEVGDRFGIGQTQNNLGVVYKSLGQYEQALEWFHKSLKLDEELNVREGVATSLSNIGDVYRRQGRTDLALEYLQKGLRMREEIGDRRGICATLNNLGLLYQDQGKYEEMLAVSRRAAGLAEEINLREDLWKAQERSGRALRALGRPAEARRSFLAAIATVESLRREVAGGEQQHQSFLENRLSPWLGMVSLLVAEGEHAEALAFAERSKARVLLDALHAGRPALRQSLSTEERQTEEDLRLRLVSLNSQLTGELRRDRPDLARAGALRADIEKARLEYEDFETRLYAARPELKVQRGEAPIIKAEELTALLPDAESALLEYVVADEETYLFVVTRAAGRPEGEVRVYTLPIKREELARQTEGFRQQLARRDLGFRAAAARLYDLLLKPAGAQLRGKTNLAIAPDDTLWDLPFQALADGGGRFLIEGAAITYAPSLTVLREMEKRRGRRGAGSVPSTLLALGNPAVGNETFKRAELTLRDGKLDPLPEAEEEVRALRQLYGTARSRVYTGAEAREDRVKSEAGEARILHFATHGILNNVSPMYSYLALADGGAGEDGLLEAWELMRLDLKADLAVLSACETARGRVGAGEGTIGLSWAMFIAGVPSIVVSQWKVESAGTRELMVNFHRALISGPERPAKAEALRQAALKLLRKPETKHPFYWAGFVLVGDGR